MCKYRLQITPLKFVEITDYFKRILFNEYHEWAYEFILTLSYTYGTRHNT